MRRYKENGSSVGIIALLGIAGAAALYMFTRKNAVSVIESGGGGAGGAGGAGGLKWDGTTSRVVFENGGTLSVPVGQSLAFSPPAGARGWTEFPASNNLTVVAERPATEGPGGGLVAVGKGQATLTAGYTGYDSMSHGAAMTIIVL